MKNKIIITALICLASSVSYAHKLNILAIAEGDTISINSYFMDGTPCKQCGFTVTDSAGKVFADGKLADDGTFNKDGKLPEKMTVTVDAGLGHKAVQEISLDGTASEVPQESSGNSEDIRKIVREELVKQTAELKAEMDKHDSKKDKIIAGIGYVLGIFGIASLLRKK